MSRRPRGPSDRPMYYYDPDDLEQADAPRLQGQSFMSKVMVFILSLCCCGIVAVVVLMVASVYAQLPQPGPTATAVGPGAAVVSIEHRTRPQHLQRSVLHRLAMLRRAQPPQKGVDLDTVRLAFPHWVMADGSVDAQAALSDIILALSYLAQEDETYRV